MSEQVPTTAIKEVLGNKKLEYDVPDTSSYPDTLTQLEILRDTTDDDSVKSGLEKLIAAAQDGSFENPITDEKISAKEKDLWPEIFWGKSKVALFTPSTEKQYKILKKYDWYCYMIDETIDAQLVMSHIKMEG